MNTPLLICLIILAFIVINIFIAFFVTTYVVFKEAYWNKIKEDNAKSSFLFGGQYSLFEDDIQQTIKESASIPFDKEMMVVSYKNTKLYGRIYRFNDSNRVQIQFHGFHGSGRRDMTACLQSAKENGMNAIVVDHRGHGKSDGNVSSFGINERKDVITWIEVAKQEFGNDVEIVLRGLSMGASTVMMSIDQKLPSNVKGIIADCPFSSPIEELTKVAVETKTKLPYPIAKKLLVAAARIYGHFNIIESSPIKAVKNCNIPILLIHGEDDRFVPFDFSKRIYEANPELIQFESFPNAGHALSYYLDKERYRLITNSFIQRVLKK